MEDESQVKNQILNLYQIFEFEAENAGNFGMFENEDGEASDAEDAILMKQLHAQFVLKNMSSLPKGMIG
jgi:hypothetical protein